MASFGREMNGFSGEVIQKCGEAGHHRCTLNYCTNQLGFALNPKISAALEQFIIEKGEGGDKGRRGLWFWET